MKTDLFQSCGHWWVFQICWHIECSIFTASSFRIWNSSTGIPSPPPALFVVMLSKVHLTSHSRMSGSRSVITPSWLILENILLAHLLQEGDPLQDPTVSSYPTLRNELSEEIHMKTKQETLLWRGVQSESSRLRKARRAALPKWLTDSGLLVMGLVSGLSLASRLTWPTVLTQGSSSQHLPRWIPAQSILGSWSSPSSFVPSQIFLVSFWQWNYVPYWYLLL